MESWKPYEEVRNHPPDFRVRYRFYSEEEGGRKNPVFQGLRCDFSYDGDSIRECYFRQNFPYPQARYRVDVDSFPSDAKRRSCK